MKKVEIGFVGKRKNLRRVKIERLVVGAVHLLIGSRSNK
tara:strand:+ start:829 stop:945 length:117 start_codon:yes stop_codon:yes gene_type:complete